MVQKKKSGLEKARKRLMRLALRQTHLYRQLFMPCVDGKDAFLSGFVALFIFVSNTLHCFQQLIDRIETPALIRIGSFIPKPFYRPIFLALYIRFSSENKITESS